MATQTDKQTVHVVVRGSAGNFQQQITAGKHHFVADEPVSVGGGDAGPIHTIICSRRLACALQ